MTCTMETAVQRRTLRQLADNMDDILAKVSIELCGRLADVCGASIAVAISASGCSALQLRQHVAAQYPSLADDAMSARVRLCIDDVIVDDAVMVRSGQIIALFPPVSGG